MLHTVAHNHELVKLLGRKPLFKPFPINLLLSLPRCLSLRCFFLSSAFLFGPSSLILVMPASSGRLRLPAAAVLLLKSAGQLQGLDSLDGYHLHATLHAIVLLHILRNELFQAHLGIPPQGSFRQPTWRPSCISCMHQLLRFFCLSNNLSVPATSVHSSFSRSVLSGSILSAWYPQPLLDDFLRIDRLCASTYVSLFT